MQLAPPTLSLVIDALTTRGSEAPSPIYLQVIQSIDHKEYLRLSTLKVNEGSSKCGIHHDMPCPFPALIMGPGLHKLLGGKWQQQGAGGRLFLADGLFDISYGPNDIVLLDGNIPPGVTGLGDISHKGKRGAHLPKRAELERFSVIMFSHFQRARGMMKHGNYDGKWCDSYMAGMATKA
jgi:hypothetical protein